MKLISFTHNGHSGFGRLDGDIVTDLSATAPDLKTALTDPATLNAEGPKLTRSNVTLLPPIPNPDKIFCIGVNYVEHREETGRKPVAYPTVFTRYAETQVADGAPLIRPAASTHFDYEGELAVIIGKAGRHVSEADALGIVAGYACYNDGSVRDWQNHTSQFTPGKNFSGTGGFGPWIITADQADLSTMSVTTRLNGVVVQHAPVSDLIFSIPAIIASITTFTTLRPGDIISTGTPGGVGAKRVPPLWMKPGDVVEVDIAGVGVLTNPVVAES